MIAIVEGDRGVRLTTAGGRVRARHLLHALRRLPDDRPLFGCRADVTGRNPDRAARCRESEGAMVEVFPRLEGTPVDCRRAGFVRVGEDGFPHPGCPGERIACAMCRPGRGGGLSHPPGRCTVRMTRGKSVPPGPMDGPGLRPWPLARLLLTQPTAWLSLQASGPARHRTRTRAPGRMPEQRLTFTRSEDDETR